LDVGTRRLGNGREEVYSLHLAFWIFALIQVAGIVTFFTMPNGWRAIMSPLVAYGVPQGGETEAGATGSGSPPRGEVHDSRRFLLGVILIVLGVAYLVAESGGPTQSPFAQVLFAQIILGQVLITSRRPIAENRLARGLTGRLRRSGTFFRLGALGTIVFAALTLLEYLHPRNPPAASPFVHLAVTVLNLLVSTVVNYVLFSRQGPNAPGAEAPRVGG